MNFFRIMKQWRNQVIESENTKKQKIQNFMALNHRKNTVKFKVFWAWSRRKVQKTALNTIISYFSRSFNQNTLQKWRKMVYYENFRLNEIQNHLNKFITNLAFQRLKGWYLQKKIIKGFQKRRVFSKWKDGFMFRRLYWPKKLREMNLKKTVFKALKGQKVLRENKNKIDRYLQLFKRRKIFKVFLKECVKMMNLRKKQEFIILSRELKLKTQIFRIFVAHLFKKKLKEKQMKLALKFDEERIKQKLQISYEERVMRKEHILYHVFSILKTNYLKKKALKTVFERFETLRKRKTKRKLFNIWLEKHNKIFSKGKKLELPDIYTIDFNKYQTPKFQIPQLSSKLNKNLKESKDSNTSSYGYWLKQYEENEKFMNDMYLKD